MRVLVVDDDPKLREYVHQRLSGQIHLHNSPYSAELPSQWE